MNGKSFEGDPKDYNSNGNLWIGIITISKFA